MRPQGDRAVIPPVPDGVQRPLWSVMIPTYNCAEYLRDTLSSVLRQDPGPDIMQIEVVDDHSTDDDPRSVVEELGATRVGFFRQPQNVGHVRNFATCLSRARGRLIHLLHGDDCVRPGFYSRLGRGFDAEPAIGAAFCRTEYIDAAGAHLSLSPEERPEPGVLDGWLETIASGQRLSTPSIVVRREVYEHLGGFDRRCLIAEDWEMWVRIAAHYPVWYDPEPLALYRVARPGSSTERASQSARLVRSTRQACDVIAEYLPSHLPPDCARQSLGRARELYAGWALQHARSLREHRPATTLRLHLEALRCSRSRWVVEAVARDILFMAGSPLRRTP